MPSIAIAQLAASPGLERNIATAVNAIEESAKAGADIVLFPEIHLSPFFPYHRRADAAQYLLTMDHEGVARLQAACRSAGIFALPNFYLKQGEHCYDASVLIDRNGRVVGTSKMVHITQQPGFYEQDYYSPSPDGFQVFETEIGRIGVVICFDRHYPESVRTCVRRGADLVLVPTANLKGEPLDLFAWEMRIAAFQNSVYIAMCNRVGAEGDAVWGGHSMASDPEGRLLVQAGDEECLVLAQYDLDQVRQKRRENKFLPLYRAEAFELS